MTIEDLKKLGERVANAIEVIEPGELAETSKVLSDPVRRPEIVRSMSADFAALLMAIHQGVTFEELAAILEAELKAVGV